MIRLIRISLVVLVIVHVDIDYQNLKNATESEKGCIKYHVFTIECFIHKSQYFFCTKLKNWTGLFC
jgi:hypothetical protein